VTVVVVIGYFVVANGFWTALFVAAAWQMLQHRRSSAADDTRWLLSSSVLPRVSVLVPAHNEAATVRESVRALLTLEYPNLEVVLVNDGSTDETLETLVRHFELRPVYPIYRHVVATKAVRALYRSGLHPGLVVVDKDNGGKADSLNAGLNLATGALVCAIDADTLIEPEALLRIVQPFLAREDVVASGGTIRVVNGSRVQAGRVVVPRAPRGPLAGLQAVEYLRAFLFGRLGWNQLGGNLIISGAFGLFKRDALREIGGYQVDSIGEDMELVVRLRYGAPASSGGRPAGSSSSPSRSPGPKPPSLFACSGASATAGNGAWSTCCGGIGAFCPTHITGPLGSWSPPTSCSSSSSVQSLKRSECLVSLLGSAWGSSACSSRFSSSWSSTAGACSSASGPCCSTSSPADAMRAWPIECSSSAGH